MFLLDGAQIVTVALLRTVFQSQKHFTTVVQVLGFLGESQNVLFASGIFGDTQGNRSHVKKFVTAPVAEWLRMLILIALNRWSSHCCGFEPSECHM